MNLVVQREINGHDVRVLNDKGHYAVYLDNELYANIEVGELNETLEDIAEETS